MSEKLYCKLRGIEKGYISNFQHPSDAQKQRSELIGFNLAKKHYSKEINRLEREVKTYKVCHKQWDALCEYIQENSDGTYAGYHYGYIALKEIQTLKAALIEAGEMVDYALDCIYHLPECEYLDSLCICMDRDSYNEEIAIEKASQWQTKHKELIDSLKGKG